MRVRHNSVPVALVVVGLGLIGGGVWSASERSAATVSVPVANARRTRPLATPVLSARRVPEVLVAPQAARRLNSAIEPILATVPANRCLYIADGVVPLVTDRIDEPMPAASNQKILTALAALDVLGPDTTFSTKIVSQAVPSASGVVAGDVWMVGGGDPIIDSDTYQRTLKYGRSPHTSIETIADSIKAAGVTSITGSVRGDESLYDDLRTVPSWSDRIVRQHQAGPLTALSVNDARSYDVVEGDPTPTVQPASDPPRYAAEALTKLLIARGVTVAGAPGAGTAPTQRVEISSVKSMPVSAIIGEMLTFSDDNTAELLLKQLGVHESAKGTTAAGLAVVNEVLTRHHLPTEGIKLLDGSGLDIGNRLTCRLISAALTDAGPKGPLAAGLAVADGEVGTLRDRYTNSPAAKRVRAKTGTLNTVTALSGWVTTHADKDIVFSFVINTGDRVIAPSDLRAEQQITEAILDYPDAVDPKTLEPISRG